VKKAFFIFSFFSSIGFTGSYFFFVAGATLMLLITDPLEELIYVSGAFVVVVC